MAGSGAIKAGRAFVELFADDSKMQRTLKKTKRTLQSWASSLSAIGGAMALADGAKIAALFGAAVKFGNAGEQLSNMSNVLSATVPELQALGYVAEQTGGSLDTINQAGHSLGLILMDAKAGSEQANITLSRLGLTWDKLANMNLTDQLRAVSDGLARMQSPMARDTLGAQLLGGAWSALSPTMIQGSKAFDAILDRGRQLPGITADDAAGAVAFTHTLRDLWSMIQRVVILIGSAAAPIFQSLLGYIRPIVANIVTWVQENKNLVGVILLGSAAGVALGAGLYVLAGVLGVAAVAVGLLGSALATVASALLFLATPLGLVTAGVIYLAVTVAKESETMGDYWSDVWDEMSDTVSTTWAGIQDAIEGGDLALALDIGLAGMKVVWTKVWTELAVFLGNLFDDLGETVGTALVTIARTILDKISSLLNNLKSILPSFLGDLVPTDAVNQASAMLGALNARASNAANVRRDDRRADADATVGEAMEDLNKLRAQAGDQADSVRKDREERERKQRNAGRGGADQFADALSGGSAVGTFSGLQASAFGAGGLQERIATGVEDTAKGVEALRQLAANGGIVWGQPG